MKVIKAGYEILTKLDREVMLPLQKEMQKILPEIFGV